MSSEVTRDGQSLTVTEAIVVEHAVKTFGKSSAIDDISFSIKRGELFGFIGSDGAGKSTLFRLLAGVMKATSGELRIFDQSPRDQRRTIGYLTQEFSLYSDLSVDENLRYFGKAHGVANEVFTSRRDYLLDLTELKPFASRLAGQLSGGMKQKLSLCCIMIFSPRVLLLDEPTTGLDPISRREIWHLLAHLTAEGVTALVATPNFSEAELCDRVALMHRGHIVKSGQPDVLREELGLSRIQIRATNLESAQAALIRVVQGKLQTEIVDVNRYGDRIDLLTNSQERVSRVLQDDLGWEIADITRDTKTTFAFEEATLENVFVTTMRARGLEEPEALSFPPFEKEKAPPSTEFGIVAEQMGKRFGKFDAVNNVSFAIKYGEIFGLLGANGAGKTTTIKMLCGLLNPTSGTALLCGRQRKEANNESRRQIGYMSQRFTLYDDLSVLENLQYYAAAYSITGQTQAERIEWILSVCNLEHSARLLVKTLPQGLKQRIAFGAAVMHRPDVLFLDEPTSGVDPLIRRQMWKLIRNFASNGTAVLVTTHFLDDAEYCHRLGMMVSGKLVAEGSPQSLRSSNERLFELFIDDVHKAFAILSEKIDPSLLSVFPRKIHVQIGSESATEQNVLSHLKDNGMHVERTAYVAPSLEDAFVQIVRRSGRTS
ncbi:MAG: ATP-binding cassette domain-containing protein [Candidatus Obscuribacterales bacterium]|nr:ATP-binding cassette domain-containing protein [Candidatus Obscuribacterales bacterium]